LTGIFLTGYGKINYKRNNGLIRQKYIIIRGGVMEKNIDLSAAGRKIHDKKKDANNALPIENHETAAWIESIRRVKPKSQVIIPHIHDIEMAKEWVDSNEL